MNPIPLSSPAHRFRRARVVSRVRLALGLAIAGPVIAQTAPPPPARPETPPKEIESEVVELSPFTVSSSSDVGYQATETLAGGRLNSSLRDVATQLQVMTPEFLQDLGITSLDDAMRYSLNSENADESIAVETGNNTALRNTTSYENNPGRTRNLGASNTTHDFFDTVVRLDSYNTERLTFASGPNSILFGNSGPSGTIDTSFKRASTNRTRYSFEIRTDNYGSLRTVADIGTPIIPKRLGIRFVQLRDRAKDWREPAYNDQDRYFVTAQFTPGRRVTLRAYLERAFGRQQAAVNTLMQDHVTPWRAVGSPTFNNGGTAFPALTAANSPVPPGGVAGIFAREQAAAATRPYAFFTSAGPSGTVGTQTNTVFIQGYDGVIAAPNNFERSILDQTLFPFDVSPAGNGNGNKTSSWTRGAILELNPFPRFFIEAGVNQEHVWHRGAALFRGTDLDLRVDPNQFLDNGGTVLRNTPNPNLGKYYLQTNSDATASARTNQISRDQRRVSASYDIDLTKRDSWLRWLGRHRIAGMAESLESMSVRQNQDFRVVSNNVFHTAANGTVFDNINANTRQPFFRYYFAPGEDPWMKLPFDILASGVQTLPGTDAAGNPVQIAAFDSPAGGASASTGQRNEQVSRTLSLQSHFLDGRLVFTYGRRADDIDIFEPDPAITTQRIAGPNSGFVPLERILESPAGFGWRIRGGGSPVTSVKGLVAHPLRWVSLSYSEANSQQVSTNIARNLDGNLAVNGAGKGRDYGISLRFLDDRLSLRYLRYETSSIGGGSALRLNNPVGTTPTSAGAVGNNIRPDIAIIERSIMVATGTTGTSERFQYFLDKVAQLSPGQNSVIVFGQGNEELAFNSDRVAEGDELTVVGNPTRSWRLSVTVHKGKSSESNIAPQWFEYIQERIPVWSRHLAQPLHTDAAVPPKTVGDLLAVAVRNFNYIQRSEGRPQARERRYRVTVVTRYGFERGPLKGANIGGAYIWRSSGVVGYPQIDITDNPFVIPGLTPAGGALTLDDIRNPYRDGSLVSCDAFVGYGRKLFRGKIGWRLQLNVRNVLGNDDPQVQRVLTTGEPVVFTAPEPRSFILSNSFTF